MRYLSLFSGIEAVSVAWEPLGWECAGVCEILPYQSAVIQAHFPNVINLHDVTKIDEETLKSLGKIDIVVFGSPCQDLSVSGKRGGLDAVKDDENRSSRLFFEGVRVFKLAQEHCGARFMLWENVPGALSSKKGSDFGKILTAMVGVEFNTDRFVWGNEGVVCGEGGLCEWAVLDAQWFGVPQRRRRVFALLDTGDWRNRRPILLEAEHLRKITKKDGSSGEKNSSQSEESIRERSILEMHMSGDRFDDTNPCIDSSDDCDTDLLKVQTFDRQGINQWGENKVASNISARDYKSPTDLICYSIAENIINREHHNGGNGIGFSHETCYTINATGVHGAAYNNKVRRLTPIECERLQGLPDDWTNVGEASNVKRYNALGRSMAVPVIRWIGKSIQDSLAP